MIVDYDVHHGKRGTQDIYGGDARVLYASSAPSRRCIPGSGPAGATSRRPGKQSSKRGQLAAAASVGQGRSATALRAASDARAEGIRASRAV